jgi:hypothetical protein
MGETASISVPSFVREPGIIKVCKIRSTVFVTSSLDILISAAAVSAVAPERRTLWTTSSVPTAAVGAAGLETAGDASEGSFVGSWDIRASQGRCGEVSPGVRVFNREHW